MPILHVRGSHGKSVVKTESAFWYLKGVYWYYLHQNAGLESELSCPGLSDQSSTFTGYVTVSAGMKRTGRQSVGMPETSSAIDRHPGRICTCYQIYGHKCFLNPRWFSPFISADVRQRMNNAWKKGPNRMNEIVCKHQVHTCLNISWKTKVFTVSCVKW